MSDTGSSSVYAQEIEAIETILSKANVLLKEFEDRERNMQEHNAKMQSFIVILEEMKNKLIMMIQSYENDNLLSKLLALNDSIDDAVTRLSTDAQPEEKEEKGNAGHTPPASKLSAYRTFSLEAPFSLDSPIFKHLRASAAEAEGEDKAFESDILGTMWEDVNISMHTRGGEGEEGEGEGEGMNNSLLSPSDGASSSSGAGGGKGKRKEKGKREDKKGKISVKVMCKICCEEFDSWYLLHELSTCKHVYCIECLRDYYTQRIKDGNVLSVPCPDPSCKTDVTPNDVKDVLDQAMWEKYDNFVLIATLKQDPNICWCPSPGCTNAIFREPTDDTKIVCDACRYQFCSMCKEQWHDGMSCEDFAQIKDKIEKSVARQASSFSTWTSKHNKQVKPCPGCKAFIEKVEGCNHMTCVSCKFQFCWMCLSEYTGMHFNDNINFPNCYMRQYYTPRPWYKPNVEKQTLVKAGKILGLGAAVMILGVPAAVIGGPIYGCIKLRQKLRPKKWVITNHGWELQTA